MVWGIEVKSSEFIEGSCGGREETAGNRILTSVVYQAKRS